MNWSSGGGWLVVALGLLCAVLAALWWLDRRRLLTRCRQIRLRAEAESDRLRLRISALKPLEARVTELQTELAGLRPVAARVPELEATIDELRTSGAESAASTLELEREAATLRARVTDVDQLELEAARAASRTVELERELSAATDRLIELERIDAELMASREEIERLSARIDAAGARDRELSREVGRLEEAASIHREAAGLAESRVEAAEALIARRDEIILILEQRLAQRDGPSSSNGSRGGTDNGTAVGLASPVPPASEPADRAEVAEPLVAEVAEPTPWPVADDGRDEARRRRKAAKAERKRAKREAKKRAKRMQQAAERAAAAASLEDPARPSSDDLQAISGIGPVMEQTLNDLGIHRLEQLAGLDDGAAATLSSRLPGVPGRVARDGWVVQARALLAGREPDSTPQTPSA